MTILNMPNGETFMATVPQWESVIQLYKDDKVHHIFICADQSARLYLEDGSVYDWNLTSARNWFKSMVKIGYDWKKIIKHTKN